MESGAWKAVALLAAVTACSADTQGSGRSNGSGDAFGSTSDGMTTDSTTATDSMTTTDSTTTDSTTTDSTTTDSTTTDSTTTDSTTTDSTTTTESAGTAMLVIAEAPQVDFGDADIAAAAVSRTINVTNEGAGEATAIAADLPAPYVFAGDAYPGTGGDCGTTLAAGDSCTIVTELVPPAFGEFVSTLTLDYDDGTAEAAVDVDLVGTGVGTLGGLLDNPGGEMPGNPTPGWDEINGNWSTTTQFSRTGSRSIEGGDVNSNDGPFALRQEVDVAAYADLIDNDGGLEVSFVGYGRSFDVGNDEFAIQLRAFDGGGSELQFDETAFQDQVEFTLMETGFVTPAQTRTIEVRLRCLRSIGENCDAYFDDLELTLTYPAP